MVRYVRAELGETDWLKETSAYSIETGTGNLFGYVVDDIDFVNPNTQTPKASAGQARRPYLNSPDQREYTFSLTVQPVNPEIPLEMALGERTHTSGIVDGGAGYTYAWSEDDKLDTFTIKHYQSGFDSDTLEERFGGCKASMSITGSANEPIEFSFDVTAAKHTAASGISASYPSQDLSQSGIYKYHMLEEVVFSGDQGTSLSGIINSFDFSWDNGLEARYNQTEGSGVQNREPYSVVETTAAEKYDMSINIDVTSMEEYMRAYEDDEKFNLILKFWKDDTDKTDGMKITLSGCTISDAPMPLRSEGHVDADLELMPLYTDIEMYSTVSGLGVV